MKRNEWYWIFWWLAATVLMVLRVWFPGVLPERAEMLPFIFIVILSGRNLAATLKEGEKEEPRWNKFWAIWSALGLLVIFLAFGFYLDQLLFLVTLWLFITLIVSIVGYLDYLRETRQHD